MIEPNKCTVFSKTYGQGFVKDTCFDNEKIKIYIKFCNYETVKEFNYPDCIQCPRNQSLKFLNDKYNLYLLIKGHSFEGFHHYTNFTNLISIFNEDFLYSRDLIEQKNIPFWNSAEKQIIKKTRNGITDHVRFYYKEDTPTLYINEGIKNSKLNEITSYSAHMPIPVLLLFDENLLFEDNAKISNGGCGNAFSKVTTDFSEALTFDWQEIFERGALDSGEIFDGEKYYERKEKTNKRNAEFLLPNKVSLDNLKKIIFRTEADRKHADFILANNSAYNKAKKYIHPKKFHVNNHRINFLENYSIKKIENGFDISFYFNKNPIDYLHEFTIFYSNGRTEKITITDVPSFGKEIHYTLNVSNDISHIEYLMDGHTCAIWR